MHARRTMLQRIADVQVNCGYTDVSGLLFTSRSAAAATVAARDLNCFRTCAANHPPSRCLSASRRRHSILLCTYQLHVRQYLCCLTIRVPFYRHFMLTIYIYIYIYKYIYIYTGYGLVSSYIDGLIGHNVWSYMHARSV